MTTQQRIQEGRGAAVNRLLKLARKAEKRGEFVKAASLMQRAMELKAEVTIWG